jgi:hypothetical protein
VHRAAGLQGGGAVTFKKKSQVAQLIDFTGWRSGSLRYSGNFEKHVDALCEQSELPPQSPQRLLRLPDATASHVSSRAAAALSPSGRRVPCANQCAEKVRPRVRMPSRAVRAQRAPAAVLALRLPFPVLAKSASADGGELERHARRSAGAGAQCGGADDDHAARATHQVATGERPILVCERGGSWSSGAYAGCGGVAVRVG